MKLPFKGQSVLPVRPYARHIRVRVFALLRSLGLEVDDSDAIPAGMRDTEVIGLLQLQRPSVLLIPFHAHRDASGAPLNGLGILVRLRDVPHLAATPIVMPISEIGEASFDLLVSREEAGSELSAGSSVPSSCGPASSTLPSSPSGSSDTWLGTCVTQPAVSSAATTKAP